MSTASPPITDDTPPGGWRSDIADLALRFKTMEEARTAAIAECDTRTGDYAKRARAYCEDVQRDSAAAYIAVISGRYPSVLNWMNGRE